MATIDKISSELEKHRDKYFADGLKYFGIENRNSYGVKVPELRKIARKYQNDHYLALELWNSEIHEMKILATIIDNPKLVTFEQSDKWTSELYSWDLCDHLSINLLAKTEFTDELIKRYIADEREFVRRTSFAIISSKATKDKKLKREKLLKYVELIRLNCDDERNYVKKGANWALKSIGKRNNEFADLVIMACKNLIESNRPNLKWIGRKTLNELNKYYGIK